MKKEIRIKKNEEISDIVAGRKCYNSVYYRAYWRINNEKTRVAVSASKKIFPNATQRNYAKRVLREAFRPCLDKELPIDIFFTAKSSISNVDFSELCADMKTMMEKLRKIIKKEAINDRKEDQ